MARKIFPIISIGLVSILGILFLIESFSIDRELLSDTFEVDAVYYEEENYIEISFLDKSGKTKSTVLEILGMEKSFQKTFSGNEFVEQVQFFSVPKYGWKTHPVTFVIDHEEFKTIGIKIEVHSPTEPKSSVIFSKM